MKKGDCEGHESGADALRRCKSIEEVLDTASRFEETARDFYTALAPKVSKRIRWLVEELAEEEQRHYDLFQELRTRYDIEDVIHERVRTPASDHRFSDCVHLPDLGDNPDDQAVLQYALGREQAAMEQYKALADSTEPGPVHALFHFLADEETQHKLELEKLYYELIHAGGPGGTDY